jgi:glyoxylase-like metal-dependent hydrolase (beta-lactamase superfamily II)
MATLHTIDLNYLGTPEAIASYILVGDGGPVMIETGPGSSVEALAAGLKGLGYEPGDVKHVLVTHIHFDHAGASGWMARQGAHVYVHEFGAGHLVDPAKLNESARRIYKDQMDYLWGELIPIPPSQVTALYDGDVLDLEGVEIRAIDTPGHAKHHHVFAVEVDGQRVAFTGDCAATNIPEAGRLVSVPTPPPEFELETWIASVEKIEAEDFDRIYPTHFGPVDHVADHLAQVKEALRAHAEFVGTAMEEGLDRQAIQQRYIDWWMGQASAAGVPKHKLDFFIAAMAEMNVAGIMRYFTKRAEKAAT